MKIFCAATILSSAICYVLGQFTSCNPYQLIEANKCFTILAKDLQNVFYTNSEKTWNSICSDNYFDQCESTIRQSYAMCATQAQVDFIMENVKAEIEGGVRYLCGDRDHVRDVLSKGGQLCMNSNGAELRACGFELGYYPTTLSYSEDYCRGQDTMVSCTVSRLKENCPGNDMHNVVRVYFESIIGISPCEPVSTFSGVHQVSTRATILSLILFIVMHKILRIF